MDLLSQREAMIVPSSPGRQPLALDLRSILSAESRLHEIQLASKMRSGELLHLFNSACLDCKKAVNQLSTEKNYVERHVARVRSVALFDKLPEVLKQKGLANARSPLGSEDIREAFLATDADFGKAQDLLAEIVAAIEFFEIRYKAFERAYYATYRLTDKHNTGENFV